MQQWIRSFYGLGLLMLLIMSLALVVSFRHLQSTMREEAFSAAVSARCAAAQELSNHIEKKKVAVEAVAAAAAADHPGYTNLTGYLRNWGPSYDGLNLLYFGTQDNEVFVYPEIELTEGYDVRARPWYEAAQAEGQTVLTEVLEDAAGYGLSMTIAVPAYDDSGRFLGAAGGDVLVPDLFELTREAMGNIEGHHFFIDADSGYVLDPEGQDTLQGSVLPEILQELVVDQTNSNPAEGTIRSDFHGQSGIFSYQSIGDTRWTAVSFIPDRSVAASGQFVFWLGLLLITATIGVFALLYYVQQRWLFKPLLDLEESIADVDPENNPALRLPRNKDDVTAGLRRVFNELLQRTQDTMERLQTQEEELRTTHEELDASFQQLRSAEQELRQQYEELLAYQQQLRESERLTRSIVDLIPDPIVRFDGQGHWLGFVSGQNMDLQSLSAGAIGHRIKNILPGDAGGHLQDGIAQAATEQSLVTLEYKIPSSEGGNRWYEARLLPSGSEVFAVLRDISHAKEAELEREDWQRLMQYIIQHDPNAIAVHDSNLHYIYVSQRYLDDYGVQETDVIGRHHYEVFPDIPEKWKEVHRRALDGEVVSGEDDRFVRADGSVEYTRWECRPWYERNGCVGGIVLYTEVLTEKKRTEAALRRSEEYRQSILHLIPDVIIHYDQFGTYLDVIGPSGEQLFLPKQELLGKNTAAVLPEGPARIVKQAIAAALEERTVQEVEYQLRPLEEGGRWYEARLLPMDDSQVVALVRDITERKQAELELEHRTYHDSLTALYNRYYVECALQDLDERGVVSMGIIIGDVNGLKIVNDSLGHSAGDTLLKKAATVLQEACPASAIVGRWAGDEFVVVVEGAGERELETICSRIGQLSREAADIPVPLNMALGYAARQSSDEAPTDVLTQAEDAMYRHKSRTTQSDRTALVTSLQRTLAAKSYETEQHGRDLEALAVRLARRVGLPERDVDEISLLALLHDLGKVGIPENILTKSGSLTSEEWDIMKKHPEIGHRIALASPDLVMVADGILSHHERWDGGGYPRGLQGREIPLSARVIAVVDAFEAMVSDRPYRRGIGREAALEEIEACAGWQFDPQLALAFVEMMRSEQGPDRT